MPDDNPYAAPKFIDPTPRLARNSPRRPRIVAWSYAYFTFMPLLWSSYLVANFQLEFENFRRNPPAGKLLQILMLLISPMLSFVAMFLPRRPWGWAFCFLPFLIPPWLGIPLAVFWFRPSVRNYFGCRPSRPET